MKSLNYVQGVITAKFLNIDIPPDAYVASESKVSSFVQKSLDVLKKSITFTVPTNGVFPSRSHRLL